MLRIGFVFVFILLIKANAFAQDIIDHWETVVSAENTWRYFPGTSEPPANWKDIDFADTSWPQGIGGFGYGDDDDGTIINPVAAVYLRITFTIYDLAQIEQAILLADFDDAYIAWLNGTELSRSGLDVENPPYNYYSNTLHEAGLYQGIYPGETIISNAKLSARFIEGENVLAIQVHNANATSSDLSSNFWLSVGMKSSSQVYQQVPNWFIAPQEYNASNLPIVKVDTDGRYIPDEPKITATMGIIDNGPGQQNHVNDPPNAYHGNIGIEIRGSSSQSFPKKQYAVELWTDTGQDTSASILGLPQEEDWILYAPYSDKSLMRNVLTFKLGADLGWYAPRTRLCELYLNESYQGVYVLTEKIKRDKYRVNISTLNPDENSGDDLTGGYIVKLDKFDGATQGFGWDSPYPPPNRADDQRIHFQYHYPKEDEITAAQRNYIQNQMTEFENTLNGPFFRDRVDGYKKYINVESFIDFAIINELTRNVDGYRLSTFLYKDKDSMDSHLYIGPLWDFNLALGNANYCQGGETSGWAWDFNQTCNGDWWLIPFWWQRLLRDPDYVIQFQNRWTNLRNGPLNKNVIMNSIDSIAALLDAPQQRNFSKWPILDEYVWPNNYVGNSYQNEINYLKRWITDRLYWLDANIAGLEAITATDDVVNAIKGISIYPNPTDGNFTINFKDVPNSKFKIIIHNQIGEIMSDKQLNLSELKINTAGILLHSEVLSKGFYVVHIYDEDSLIFSGKLMVR